MEKQKICGIYKITSPSGKVYIGASKNIARRKSEHKTKGKRERASPKLKESYLEHSFENHTFELLEECLLENIKCRERYWQDEYDVLGEGGLNKQLTRCDKCNLPNVYAEDTTLRRNELNRIKANNRRGEKNNFYGKEPWNKGIVFMALGSNPSAKKVIDTVTEEVFDCVKAAANFYEVGYSSMRAYLNPNNDRSNPTSLVYLSDYEELNSQVG